MANVIRVDTGGKWAYVPDTHEYRSRLERFASAGIAEVRNGTVHLLSDAGPVFWNMLKKTEKQRDSKLQQALAATAENGVFLSPDEELRFGKQDGALGYSDILDLSVLRHDPRPGLSFSFRYPQEGDVVSTLWPKSKIVIPARMLSDKVELADKAPDKERCFVLDEGNESLLTVGLPTDDKALVHVASPKKFGSWLLSSGSSTTRLPASNFSILFKSSGQFVISDKKRNRIYVGKIHSPPGCEQYEFEQAVLENTLLSKGIGAVLPKYELTTGDVSDGKPQSL